MNKSLSRFICAVSRQPVHADTKILLIVINPALGTAANPPSISKILAAGKTIPIASPEPDPFQLVAIGQYDGLLGLRDHPTDPENTVLFGQTLPRLVIHWALMPALIGMTTEEQFLAFPFSSALKLLEALDRNHITLQPVKTAADAALSHDLIITQRNLALISGKIRDYHEERLQQVEQERQEELETLTVDRAGKAIPAVVKTDDGSCEIQFDAEPWFAQATFSQIKAVMECDWGGDYPADNVAEYFRDGSTRVLFDLVDISRGSAEPLGFECRVNAAHALGWIYLHRPNWVPTFVRINPDATRLFSKIEEILTVAK